MVADLAGRTQDRTTRPTRVKSEAGLTARPQQWIAWLLDLDSTVRFWLAALIAAAAGMAQFALFFAGREPSPVVYAVGLIALAAGVALGALVAGHRFVLWCVAACWGAYLAGAMVLLGSGHAAGYVLLGIPPVVSIAGGLLGHTAESALRRRYS